MPFTFMILIILGIVTLAVLAGVMASLKDTDTKED